MKKFSLWCDFIENEFLDHEFLDLLYAKTINGATSNPAIFKNAILNSSIYKEKIKKINIKDKKSLYEYLAIEDIQKAADKLSLNFYENNDGFISIEIDPRLKDNTSLSLAEAKRLYTQISKENVMMKIPATNASYEVMYELMKSGISVNATLIFDFEQTKKCFEALNLGLKEFRKNNIASKKEPQAVISIFVSRFDRLLNEKVVDKNFIGILTATKSYKYIISQNEDNIRALFASTGIKGDDLEKDYYIKELLYDKAINTAPLDAINAFKGKNLVFKEPLKDECIEKKLQANISNDELKNACKFLLDDGLEQFCIAYEDILKSL
ncbi:transaldolase [Campylobacter lari]|uniref:transaldolase n=1 Tax=Campylobacter lari TaxID=201 RepID=UPI0010777940|nr:transaldolase [Campylobacter lari]EAC1840413.1 transaldolase [Campylobacter lari]EAH4935934.1 transaldolase [Campylobacter lari]EAH7780815.1 transaldolase [Campylobacter lari]EAH8420343.1 transaldolase [Campylobacter lari]EAI0903195.1 transaldolase [Campylobacter lari]